MFKDNRISKYNAIREAICLFLKATGEVEFHQYRPNNTEEQRVIDRIEMVEPIKELKHD